MIHGGSHHHGVAHVHAGNTWEKVNQMHSKGSQPGHYEKTVVRSVLMDRLTPGHFVLKIRLVPSHFVLKDISLVR